MGNGLDYIRNTDVSMRLYLYNCIMKRHRRTITRDELLCTEGGVIIKYLGRYMYIIVHNFLIKAYIWIIIITGAVSVALKFEEPSIIIL